MPRSLVTPPHCEISAQRRILLPLLFGGHWAAEHATHVRGDYPRTRRRRVLDYIVEHGKVAMQDRDPGGGGKGWITPGGIESCYRSGLAISITRWLLGLRPRPASQPELRKDSEIGAALLLLTYFERENLWVNEAWELLGCAYDEHSHRVFWRLVEEELITEVEQITIRVSRWNLTTAGLEACETWLSGTGERRWPFTPLKRPNSRLSHGESDRYSRSALDGYDSRAKHLQRFFEEQIKLDSANAPECTLVELEFASEYPPDREAAELWPPVLARAEIALAEPDALILDTAGGEARLPYDRVCFWHPCPHPGSSGLPHIYVAGLDEVLEARRVANPGDKMQEHPRLFVSHCSSNEELAQEFVSLVMTALALTSRDIRCTSLPGFGVRSGSRFSSVLRDDLRKARAVVGLLTPEALTSSWVLFELGAAWGGGSEPVPVLCCGTTPEDLPGPLAEVNAKDLSNRGHVEDLLNDVAQSIEVDLEKPSVYLRQLEKVLAVASSDHQSEGHHDG